MVQQDEALWNHFMGIHELHTLLDGVDDSGMLPLHYAAKKTNGIDWVYYCYAQ